MSVRGVGLNLVNYLGWLAAVFVAIFVLRSRFFANSHFPPPLLFLVASLIASGITVAQAMRNRRQIGPAFGCTVP